MLFNSYEYILLFLPLSLIVFYSLNHWKLTMASKSWLVFVSLFFYGWWKIDYIPLIIGSILFNFAVGSSLSKHRGRGRYIRKLILIIGLLGNLGLLGYFKYTNFLLTNINYLFYGSHSFPKIILPLAISFYTFTQIAYIFDAYRGIVKEYNFMNYLLFVTFFPHLLAGPIIHHSEMMPQFDQIRNKILNYDRIAKGIYLFSIGLSKKVIIADFLAGWVNQGYDHAATLHFLEAWRTSLAYTLQIYFDFSGYTDMAIGSALMFNIRLPINFNTPYRALNIQDFWRRWHITLSRFLRDYVYIPLGGNRVAPSRNLANLMITFIIGGIWHGAGWTFVFWGFLHGLAMVIHRIWQKTGINIPKILAWFITFHFINATWIFFRANNFADALNLLRGMLGLRGEVLPLVANPHFLKDWGIGYGVPGVSLTSFFIVFLLGCLAIAFRNSNQMIEHFKPTTGRLAFAASMMSIALLTIARVNSEFIYFNF
jgi:alginate O-acetyltransferase complex protein AlgI